MAANTTGRGSRKLRRCQACGVTEVTIRTRFNDMMDVLGMRTEVRDDGDHHSESRVTVDAVC